MQSHSIRNVFLSLLVPVFSIAAGSGLAIETAESIADVLSAGMHDFVAGLDDDQRDDALYAFDDDERFDLRLAPIGLEGLKISDMSAAQWGELEELLAGVLSPTGLEKMNTIRSLEREVAEGEGGLLGLLFGGMRDAKRYFLAIFGEPASDATWGLRFDGHHLSLNWTVIPGAPLSATPLFFGGQPRIVPPELERAGLRVLAAEEDTAVAFLNELSPDERKIARIPWQKGGAFRRPMSIGGEVALELGKASGLSRTMLDAPARARFDAVVEVHLGNFAPAIADRYRAQIYGDASGLSIVYAADEPIESGRALYYRIQGGGFMIEFDDTAKQADHIHVVLRNPTRDFGRDALADHLAQHHSD
jgi:hypothetical protein